MKRLTLFIIFTLLYSFAYSQEIKQTIGFSGGVSISNLIYKKPVLNPAKYKIGHSYGFNYEIGISENAFLVTGLSIQDKGFTNVIDNGFSGVNARVTHRYLSVPVGFGLRAGGEIYAKFILRANFGILILHESYNKLSANGMIYEEVYIYETDNYTPFDFSINPILRIGYELKSGFSFFMESDFSISVNHFFNKTFKPFSNPVNNYSFSLRIGFDCRI
jgi:hypothetical protein